MAYLGKFPSKADWEYYTQTRLKKSLRLYMFQSTIYIILFYIVLAFLHWGDFETLTGQRAQKIAPYLMLIAPFYLYYAHMSDIRKALSERKI